MNKKQIENIKLKSELWRKKNNELALTRRMFKKRKKHNKKHNKKHKNIEVFKSYYEYIKSEKWKAKRKLILGRSKGLCENCGIKKAEQVHHKTYNHLYHEPLTDLVALCSVCHQDIHGLLTQDYIDEKVYESIKKEIFNL